MSQLRRSLGRMSVIFLLSWGIQVPVATAAPIQVTLYDGGIAPASMTAKKGQTFQVQVKNSGKSVHNFVIKDFFIFTQNLNPGETTTVSFQPDKLGSFSYYSDKNGIPEAGMQGSLKVTP